MKTAISLPDQLYRKAEVAAKRLRISRSQLYATALADYLDQHESRHITDALDEIYAQESATVDELLNQMQLASLPKDKW